MALVKTWQELKDLEGKDPSVAVAIPACVMISKLARDMVEGAELLPESAELALLDAVAKAGSGAFSRAYDRAMDAAMRTVIEMVADFEAERKRQEVLGRFKSSVRKVDETET